VGRLRAADARRGAGPAGQLRAAVGDFATPLAPLARAGTGWLAADTGFYV
jgi:hypothetical protein